MKNLKNLISTIVLSFIAVIYISANDTTPKNFTEGTSLTVMAPSGLSIRNAPGKHARVLEVIEYGEKVSVLDNSEYTIISERIDWVDGNWILVEYQGTEGYIFDGYLSALPMPNYEFELCYLDMDLIHPLESWANYHFDYNMTTDTTVGDYGLNKTVSLLENGHKLVKKDEIGYFKMDLYLSDVRLMDAYHLLLSMLPSKAERATFYNRSIFIEDVDGQLERVKINLDDQILISKTKDNQIRIRAFDSNEGTCSL